MSKSKPIKIRIWLPDANGYREYNERLDKGFSQECVKRMGDVLNDYFGQHPDVYERMCKEREESPVLQV